MQGLSYCWDVIICWHLPLQELNHFVPLWFVLSHSTSKGHYVAIKSRIIVVKENSIPFSIFLKDWIFFWNSFLGVFRSIWDHFMQTFSSDRKRVLRILLTIHQVPVKKKRNRNGPEKNWHPVNYFCKKKGKRHQL